MIVAGIALACAVLYAGAVGLTRLHDWLDARGKLAYFGAGLALVLFAVFAVVARQAAQAGMR